MRTLLTSADLAPTAAGPPATEDGVLARAYAWPASRPWTRVAMLRALDGGVAGADGRSRSISSDADRSVLAEIRRLCDAIVVGATTLREEPYGPILARPDSVAERRRLGLSPAPVLVTVSASLDLPWDEPVFGSSERRPIVATVEGADETALRRAREHAEIVVLPGHRVTAHDLVGALHDRGLNRLVCEGGPGLLASFAAEDLVDEVDLTVSPTLPTRVIGGHPPALPGHGPHRFDLAGLLLHDSFLFARYLRVR
jgi:riboflavin-specific deaminase-like protein